MCGHLLQHPESYANDDDDDDYIGVAREGILGAIALQESKIGSASKTECNRETGTVSDNCGH